MQVREQVLTLVYIGLLEKILEYFINIIRFSNYFTIISHTWQV